MNKLYILVRRHGDYTSGDKITFGTFGELFAELNFLNVWKRVLKVDYLQFRKQLWEILDGILKNISSDIVVLREWNEYIKRENEISNSGGTIFPIDDDDFFDINLLDYLQTAPNINDYDLVFWNGYLIRDTGIVNWDNNPTALMRENRFVLSNCFAVNPRWKVFVRGAVGHIVTTRLFKENTDTKILHTPSFYGLQINGFWSLSRINRMINMKKITTEEGLETNLTELVGKYKTSLRDTLVKDNINIAPNMQKYIDIVYGYL